MYYFKDHINLTNNLQDNLYILRQRQLKEEMKVWSPSSGGIGIPESDAGNIELESRMRNIKQSGDRQQSKEYLEMEAELNRRKGTGSAPKASSDPSFKPAPQSSASDWRANYDTTRAVVTQDGRTEQMDKFEGQRGNVGGSRVNLVKPAASDITRERTSVQGLQGSERLVGSAETKDGRAWIDPRDRQSAEEMSKRAKELGMSVEALDIITYGNKDDVAKLKVTGIPAKTQKGAASSGSLGGPDPDVQRGQHNINDPSSPAYDPNANTMDFRQEVQNFSKLFKSPEEFKTGSVNDTGANGLAYGSQNKGGRRGLPTTQEEAMRAQELAQFNVPGGVTIPATKPAAPQSSPRAGGRPMEIMDMDGFPVSITPPAPSQEDANTFGPPAPVKRTPGGTMVSDAQRAVTDKAAGALKDIIKGGYDWMKKQPQSTGMGLGDMTPGQPYVVPGSQDWYNMSQEDQENMVTRALKNKEVHKFTGGRDAVDPNEPGGERMRFNTDDGSGAPFAADINQRSKLANDVIDRKRQNMNRDMMGLWNRSDLDDEISGRPWFWPKASEMGQESVNDILDRMQKPKEISDEEKYEKELSARVNNKMGSSWARNRFSLKNYFESQRDRAEMVEKGRAAYKAEKVSSKPSWAK